MAAAAPAAVDLTTPVRGSGTAQGPAPRFTSQEQVDTALADVDRAIRSAAGAPLTDTAAGPARPVARPASLDIGRGTTLDDAARRLADDLRSVPGIERFAEVRLGELERTGPRPLRTMWRLASEQLDDRFGQLTIGELIDRYGPTRRAT